LGDYASWLTGTAFPTWKGISMLIAHATNLGGRQVPYDSIKALECGNKVVVHLSG